MSYTEDSTVQGLRTGTLECASATYKAQFHLLLNDLKHFVPQFLYL